MNHELIYRLEHVVLNKDEWDDFEGPLSLILLLLSKNKIEIRDIRISELLEQYLEHLRLMQEMDLEVASEFVQMASHLTYIKTRMLLTEEKDPSELETLVDALEEMKAKEAYAAVREVVQLIGRRAVRGSRIHTRGPLPRGDRPYEYSHTALELLVSLGMILLRGAGDVSQEQIETIKKAAPKPIIFHVREKNEQLKRLLKKIGQVKLGELFSRCKSRSEIVATFLSILELCSEGVILVRGEKGNYDISGRMASGSTG